MPTAQQQYTEIHKIGVVGLESTGKTHLVNKFLNLDHRSLELKLEESYRKKVVIDEKECYLDFFDYTGKENVQKLKEAYIRAQQGFLLLFSVTDSHSFAELGKFIDKIKEIQNRPDIPIVILANKCDLEDQRVVSSEDAKAFAKQLNIPIFEGSVTKWKNVEESMQELVREIRKFKEKNAPKKKDDAGNCTTM